MIDVLIIGAGPAGALAAILLARAGLDVHLVEQHRFPRDKVCGECISALGLSVLDQASLLAPLHALGATPLAHASLHAPTGNSATFPLPVPMLGLSRAALDQALLAAAVEAGARLHQPVRCESLEAGASGSPSAVLHDLATNTHQTLSARCILLADGKSALLHPRPAPTKDLGLKAHFTDVEADPKSIHLFTLNGHYAGLARIEGNRWNLALAVPRGKLQRHPTLDSLFVQLLKENPTLSNALFRAKRVTPWLTSPLPRFALRGDWPPGIIPLGNAAAAIDPIGGEGIGLALKSGAIAAELILKHHPIPPDSAILRADLTPLWRTRRLACRTAALLLSKPRIASFLIPLAAQVPHFLAAPLTALGKSPAAPTVAGEM